MRYAVAPDATPLAVSNVLSDAEDTAATGEGGMPVAPSASGGRHRNLRILIQKNW